MRLTIPNLLSVLRVLLAPGVALAFALFDRPDADRIAVAVFLAAAVTDYLDGVLARALRQESAFGRMLDPIADKAMVLTALAILVALYDMDWPVVVPVAAIILREVLVSGLREFLGDVKLAVTQLAKWKTTLQMVALCLLLLQGAIDPELEPVPVNPIFEKVRSGAAIAAGGLGLVLLWIAAWFTVVTGAQYFAKGMPHSREREGIASSAAGKAAADQEG
jgi:CDP-diacylglycerol--glycerol-3-phosphate 3-phosphatidyltransferase